jgi:hypothetical protein
MENMLRKKGHKIFSKKNLSQTNTTAMLTAADKYSDSDLIDRMRRSLIDETNYNRNSNLKNKIKK